MSAVAAQEAPDATPSLNSGIGRVPAYEHVYVHVPFCARRCSYCDFAIAVRREVPWQEYVDGVRRELTIQLGGDRPALRTLYFGGGTPSRLGVDGVQALLAVMCEHCTWDDDAEVTLEANPEDISVESVRRWRAAGINRLSIGVQSFHNEVLHWMHRVHDADAAKRAVAAAREGGIHDHSIDLIFATPDNIVRSWTHDLEQAIALGADHVSLYGLTVEPHTPLGRWSARGDVHEAGEERYEHEFLEAHERLVQAGYEHYEVSNYARPGRRARHNSAYWLGVPYLGVGPSAHGYDGARRRWNESAYAAWLRQVNEGRDPRAGEEVLTQENRVAESVYLGLRTVDGLQIDASERAHVSRWLDAGWANVHDTDHLTCTPMGWLRLDALAADLTAFRGTS